MIFSRKHLEKIRTTIPVYNIKGAKYKLWWAYLLNKQKTSKIFQKVFVYERQYNKVYKIFFKKCLVALLRGMKNFCI